MNMLAVNFKFLLLSLVLATVARSQDEEQVCVRLPRGPAGPMGPQGAPGDVAECSCNETALKEELKTQKKRINTLTKAIEDLQVQSRLVKVNGNETANITIDYLEIKEIVNREWKKRNNCPIGLSDNLVLDADITSSSVYNNDSSRYGAHLARLDNQPEEDDIGAWRPKEISPIRNIQCSDTFYRDSSRYNRGGSFSASFSSTELVQLVRCPSGCFNQNYQNNFVYGSSLYTDISSVCRAAIHHGDITDEGGVVTVHRNPRRVYPGSINHRISSSSYTSERGSFTFGPNLGLPWIQVDLGTPTHITGVVTQGRPTSEEEWVKNFKIQYGNNETDLITIKSADGIDVVFTGNTDRTSHVTNMFLEPITARFLRLVVYTWHSNIALRLEYLSC